MLGALRIDLHAGVVFQHCHDLSLPRAAAGYAPKLVAEG
jgi:hypothetical protein